MIVYFPVSISLVFDAVGGVVLKVVPTIIFMPEIFSEEVSRSRHYSAEIASRGTSAFSKLTIDINVMSANQSVMLGRELVVLICNYSPRMKIGLTYSFHHFYCNGLFALFYSLPCVCHFFNFKHFLYSFCISIVFCPCS